MKIVAVLTLVMIGVSSQHTARQVPSTAAAGSADDGTRPSCDGLRSDQDHPPLPAAAVLEGPSRLRRTTKPIQRPSPASAATSNTFAVHSRQGTSRCRCSFTAPSRLAPTSWQNGVRCWAIASRGFRLAAVWSSPRRTPTP